MMNVRRIAIGRNFCYFSFLLFLFAFFSYFYLDRPLLEFFYDHRNMHLYSFVYQLTHLGKSTWYIIVAFLLYLLWRKNKPSIAKAALFVFGTTVISGILVNIPKVIFGRARPQLYLDDHIYGFYWFKTDVLYRSFPSGHATTAIAVWLAFALLFPRFRLWLLLIGMLVAFTRMIIYQHYLSDILIGGWLGAATTLALYQLLYPKEPHHA